MMKTIGFLVTATAIGAVMLSMRNSGEADSPPSTSTTKPMRRIHPVAALTVQVREHYEYQHDYLGEVVAGRRGELGFERAGRIAAMEISEGDAIEEGAVLAKLDTDRLQEQRKELLARTAQIQARLDELVAGARPEVIAAAESTVKDLTHQLELANRNRGRREKLVAQAMSAREELETATFGAQSIAAKLAVATHQWDELNAGTREEILRAQQSELQQAQSLVAQNQIEIDRSVLRAPYACTVTSQMADVGQVVDQGTRIISVIANDAPEVWVGIPVSVASTLTNMGRVKLRINDQVHDGVAKSVVPQLDRATRTMTAILALPGVTVHQVPIGQTARLSIAQQIQQRGTWLPLTSLVKGTRGLWSCLRLVEQSPDFSADTPAGAVTGILERCDVEVLHSDGDRVFVRSALDAGDLVVVNGTGRVTSRQWAYVSRHAQGITP